MVPPNEAPRNIPNRESATVADLERSLLHNLAEMNRLVSSLHLAQAKAWSENRLKMAEFSVRLRRENALASEMAGRLETTIKNYIAINYQHAKGASQTKPPPPGMYG